MTQIEMNDIENVFLSDEEDVSVSEMEERAEKEAAGLEDANIEG